MRIRVINDTQELRAIKEQILELFFRAYSRELHDALWDWAYILNPTGEPIVAIAEEDSEVVGHYAIIPMPLAISRQTIKGYLSMTTMVRPDFQGRGLFKSLAKETYKDLDSSVIVFGFPNSNSIQGFVKYLDWEIGTQSYLVNIDSEELIDTVANQLCDEGPKIELDLGFENFLKWRLSKPNANYEVEGDFIYKSHNSSVDLVNFDLHRDQEKILRFPNVNLLTSDPRLLAKGNRLSNYPFGYKKFSIQERPMTFIPTLLMSDVF